MDSTLATDFGGLIAERIKAAHRDIASDWLDRLASLLPVGANSIFPSDRILDHIPALIHEIADYIGGAERGALVANTVVFSKARELGELRFAQKASVHQLLREYHLLSDVLGRFIHAQFDATDLPYRPADIVGVVNRLNDAVFVLLQTTVDTFVGRYSEMIDEQTMRLEGFNRMVTHELRQPMSSIQYAVEILRTVGPEHGAARERSLDIAQRSVRRLGHLLGMLATLVRPEQDTPQVQEVDVAKVVDDVLAQMAETAEARGVALRARVLPQAITVDLSRLELLLVNLLSNAIKYRDPERDDPFVEVTAACTGDACRIEVRDNGLGIRQEDQPNIFRRFFRGHASRDGELGTDGVGLGLAIAAECAKAMRGTISCESAVGHGTTFTVTLPFHPAGTDHAR